MGSDADRAADYVTLVEVLELLGPFEEFAAAVGAMVQRVEAEGVRELVNVRFYGDAGSSEVGVILTFSDRGRMIDHMNMVGGWEEFRAFGRLVRLADVRVYGRLSVEAEAWIGAWGTPSRKFEHYVAGFVRAPEIRDGR